MQHVVLPALVVEKDEGYQLEGWISVIRHCSEVTQYPIKSIEDARDSRARRRFGGVNILVASSINTMGGIAHSAEGSRVRVFRHLDWPEPVAEYCRP